MVHYTEFSEVDLMPCLTEMKNCFTQRSSTGAAVIKKYSHEKYGSVSSLALDFGLLEVASQPIAAIVPPTTTSMRQITSSSSSASENVINGPTSVQPTIKPQKFAFGHATHAKRTILGSMK